MLTLIWWLFQLLAALALVVVLREIGLHLLNLCYRKRYDVWNEATIPRSVTLVALGFALVAFSLIWFVGIYPLPLPALMVLDWRRGAQGLTMAALLAVRGRRLAANPVPTAVWFRTSWPGAPFVLTPQHVPLDLVAGADAPAQALAAGQEEAHGRQQ